ncbi:MAG: recombination protein RecR [Gammaproteobacteria bacterium]|nr:recombination protein RecR [Gammaproteobacteria bacterium]
MNIIEQLTESLRCLPGVGPKTAQRLVYFFLKNHRKQALILAKNLDEAMNTVVQCQVCNNFSVETICSICKNPNRNRDLLCIVEQPTDLLAIEQSHTFSGYYFILTGKISPIDGIGIADIGLDKLEHYLNNQPVKEIIIALTPSLETQATLQYIQQIASAHPILLSQLAQGVPTGSELQFLDPITIGTAMKHRQLVDN